MNRMNASTGVVAGHPGLAWAKVALGDAQTGVPGDIVEIAADTCCAYDLMRAHFPDRKIWVVEKPRVCGGALSDCCEAEAGLARLRGADLALVSYDLSGATPQQADVRRYADAMVAALTSGGVIISSQELPEREDLEAVVPRPNDAFDGHYIYRRL